MTTTTEKSRQIECNPTQDWAMTYTAASHRDLSWYEIVSELIDNALANAKDGEPCRINLLWGNDNHESSLTAIDYGRGSDEIEPFFVPGKTGGNPSQFGNSTFGSGLFTCECALNGTMFITTDSGNGIVLAAKRTVREGNHCVVEEYESDTEIRESLLIPDNGGTLVMFQGFAKAIPAKFGNLDKIVEQIKRAYSILMRSNDLKVLIILNEEYVMIQPNDLPEFRSFNTRVIKDEEGHEYEVEWGVTKEPVSDLGVQLVYGGKMFEITTKPCGDYHLGHFYATIKIPQSVGREIMDSVKRRAAHEKLKGIYDKCFDFFKSSLEESHKLSKSDENIRTSEIINGILSIDDEEEGTGSVVSNGDQDVRRSNGRKRNGNSRKRKSTSSRRGRNGRQKRQPAVNPNKKIIIEWCSKGKDGPMAEYDISGIRVFYNSDSPVLKKVKDNEPVLAYIAAAHMAHTINNAENESRPPQFKDDTFEDIYRKLFRIVSK